MSNDATWSAEMDAALRAGRTRSPPLSFKDIGLSLGVSKDAALGRWHRINKMVFAYDIARDTEREVRAAERRKREEAALEELDHLLIHRRPKGAAIAAVRKMGVSLTAIGRHLGVTKQAAQQLSSEWM